MNSKEQVAPNADRSIGRHGVDWKDVGLAALLATLATTAAAETAVVELEISGLQNVSGDLYVAAYDSEDTWLGDKMVLREKVVIEDARNGELVTTQLALAPGNYALTIFFDRNGNGELDTNFIGVPKEPVALSNNARPRFGPPKYRDAVFSLGVEGIVQHISMTDI